MRLESDYLVLNRELFVSIILEKCADDSEIEIEGKLPTEYEKSIKTHVGSKKNRYIINKKSRGTLSNIFTEKDNEIKNTLLGLHMYSDTDLMFQGFHFYDYGSDQKSGRIVFFHDAMPEFLLHELLNKKAIKVYE